MLSTSLDEFFLKAASADREDDSQVKEAEASDGDELLDQISEALGDSTNPVLEKRASRLGIAKILASLDILANN